MAWVWRQEALRMCFDLGSGEDTMTRASQIAEHTIV
jgi:hypothetical protein